VFGYVVVVYRRAMVWPLGGEWRESVAVGRVPSLLHSFPALLPAIALKRQGILAPGFSRGVPVLSLHLRQVPIPRDAYRAYRQLCDPAGVSEDGDGDGDGDGAGDGAGDAGVLVCYPSVRVFATIPRLVTHPAFPFSPLALIHIKTKITAYKPIRVGDEVDYTVSTQTYRKGPKGFEVDLLLQASLPSTGTTLVALFITHTTSLLTAWIGVGL